jgi:hypothetical protein
VFVVRDTRGHEVSFTCNTVTAEATSATKTATALVFGNIVYGEGKAENCTVAGTPGVTVDMNGCTYEFKSAGGGAAPGAQIVIACPTGKEIEITIPNCTFTVPGQTVTGARYHNIGEEVKNNTEVTVENNAIKNIKTTVSAGGTFANCHVEPSETLTAEYVTGNVIATGETDPPEGTPAMAGAWWA